MKPIQLEDYHNLVVLTGAGISVASGLRPYRGPGGLWEENPAAQQQATAEQLRSDPGPVWRLFGPLRALARQAEPNAAHLALAQLEERCRAERREFLLVTQNVDGLHQRAGSREVAEYHGSLARSRCTSCSLEPFPDHNPDLAPCPACGAALRPDIVLFGEEIPPDVEMRAKRALRDCDLFLAVGTSGRVAPAASFVRSASYRDARTILVNLEPLGGEFSEEYLGPAEEILPRLLTS